MTTFSAALACLVLAALLVILFLNAMRKRELEDLNERARALAREKEFLQVMRKSYLQLDTWQPGDPKVPFARAVFNRQVECHNKRVVEFNRRVSSFAGQADKRATLREEKK